MNKDEDCLIKWFWEKFNSCYLVKHENYQESIFMFYDPQYIRKLKLANISGEKIKPKIDITGICLFEQDWKNMNFRCNYKEVWDYLGTNYSNKYSIVQSFIKNRLQEHTKMSSLTPQLFGTSCISKLQEHTKMSSLTPLFVAYADGYLLQEHTKMSSLTPTVTRTTSTWALQEHTKMSSLTPLLLISTQMQCCRNTQK